MQTHVLAPSSACGGGLGRGNSVAGAYGEGPLPKPPTQAGEGIARTRRTTTWRAWRFALIALALGASHPAVAVQPDEMLKDATLEARARALSRELRCMVCQNQSIDDSDAPLARDLRILVRERIKSGDNDQQILDFLVSRYGQFVLLRPKFEWETAILWLTPLA